MAFDTGKHEPLTNKACIDVARPAMGSMVSNPEEITTYTWRRVMPTLGLSAKFSGLSGKDAYYANPFEVEAYENDNNIMYLEERPLWAWRKYLP